MTRNTSMLVFFAVFLALVAAIHFFFWARLVRDPSWPRGVQRGLTVGIAILALSIPASFFLGRSLAPDSGRGFLLVAYSWLGLLLFLLLLLGLGDLGRLLHWLVVKIGATPPPDEGRRLAIARMLALGAAAGSAGLGGFAAFSALRGLATQRIEVPLERLPKSLDGMTIVQLTDLHVGPTLRDAFVQRVVEHVNALEPDIVAITGDLVDGSVDKLAPLIAPLARLRARYGVYFVTGNHEYYSGADDWVHYLRSLGIHVLHNERVSIGQGEDRFDLAGVPDHHGGRFSPGHTPDLATALAGRDPTHEVVLLAHQPIEVFNAARLKVGLQLSGHTHGGQIWPWNWLVPLQQPVVKGLQRFGETLIYVSSGTGYWGPPMRLGTTAEVTQVVLRATPRSAAPHAQASA